MNTLHALLAATGLDVNGIWQNIQAWMGNYQRMFPGLADLCKTARAPFMTIAALMLMCAYGKRVVLARAIESQVIHVVSAMVFVTMVCTSPQMLLMTSQGFVDLANQMAPNSVRRNAAGRIPKRSPRPRRYFAFRAARISTYNTRNTKAFVRKSRYRKKMSVSCKGRGLL